MDAVTVHEYESLLPVLNDTDPDIEILTPVDKKENDHRTPFYFCIPGSWIGSKKTAVDNSPFATIILLLNNMIGSGVLVQAFIFRETGIIVAIFEYLIVGLMTYTGVDLMIKCADEVQIFEYSELATKALGWWGAIAVDVRSVFFQFY